MLQWSLVLAGIGQLALAAASLAIPRVLRWRADTAKLQPLTRCVFWVYAGYILGTNVAFGLLSALAPHWLLDGSPLARAVAAFIALYWGARLLVQVSVFRRHRPPGARFRVIEVLFVLLFASWTAIYVAVAVAGADAGAVAGQGR